MNGQPLLVRGGELGNPGGEPDHLRAFWLKPKAMNINTVVAPVH